jgi:hypothetical protein
LIQLKPRFAKWNEYTVGRGDKPPEEKDDDQSSERTGVRSLFRIVHVASLFIK